MIEYLTDKDYPITIAAEKNIKLEGNLFLPHDAIGLVLFVHGSGSSRLSPRNKHVAHILNQAHLGTLLFDLLTPEEEEVDNRTSELRFDVEFLATRLVSVNSWVLQQPSLATLPIGYFGASTGAAAALLAAASQTSIIKAVVSRGGRPDLAEKLLPYVQAPTLLIVGGEDFAVIQLNQQAFAKMACVKSLEIIPGATHLFEEPGTLDQAAHLAIEWFLKYLKNTN